jgi:inhibitor of KinA
MARQASVRFLDCGDTALTVEFGDAIDARINRQVLALAALLAAAALPGIIEVVPTFRSLTIHYDPLATEAQQLQDVISAFIEDFTHADVRGRRFDIPVCYEEGFGVDLAEVAALTGLSPVQVIDCHTAPIYYVYAVGFLPGFPYLGGLREELVLPRRPSPRLVVPAGSVAIAMAMTGIYPFDSPGGWHLLGRTPVPLFDANQTPPVLFQPGDTVHFQPVTADLYGQLAAKGSALWRSLQAPLP